MDALGQPILALPAAGEADFPPLPELGVRSPRARGRRAVIAEMFGVEVVQDIHLHPGEPGHYIRLSVNCPQCAAGHPDCGKRRNIGEAQCRNFGQVEPLGFIGVWLERANSFADKASHLKFTPSLADIRSFLIARRWWSPS